MPWRHVPVSSSLVRVRLQFSVGVQASFLSGIMLGFFLGRCLAWSDGSSLYPRLVSCCGAVGGDTQLSTLCLSVCFVLLSVWVCSNLAVPLVSCCGA